MKSRFAFLTLLFALALRAISAVAADVGEQAPEFQARGVANASPVALHAFRGKVVLVDFWASWCAPCNAAMPQLEALSKEFPADQFVVVGVNVDSNLEDARRALAKHGVSYPNASDPSGKLPKRFGLETMPTSYLIDREGVIRFVHKGFRKGDIGRLREQVRKQLDAKAKGRS